MIRLKEYLDLSGRSPFGDWLDRLDPRAAAIVVTAVGRLADGNTSRVELIGEGAAEIKIDRGPGYRVYFGWDGRDLVIFLGGGTKHRQSRDIAAALAHWRDYKARKQDRANKVSEDLRWP